MACDSWRLAEMAFYGWRPLVLISIDLTYKYGVSTLPLGSSCRIVCDLTYKFCVYSLPLGT